MNERDAKKKKYKAVIAECSVLSSFNSACVLNSKRSKMNGKRSKREKRKKKIGKKKRKKKSERKRLKYWTDSQRCY